MKVGGGRWGEEGAEKKWEVGWYRIMGRENDQSTLSTCMKLIKKCDMYLGQGPGIGRLLMTERP